MRDVPVKISGRLSVPLLDLVYIAVLCVGNTSNRANISIRCSQIEGQSVVEGVFHGEPEDEVQLVERSLYCDLSSWSQWQVS